MNSPNRLFNTERNLPTQARLHLKLTLVAAALVSAAANATWAADSEWKDLFNQAASAELQHNPSRAEYQYKHALAVIERESVDAESKARVLCRLARLYVEQRRLKESDPLVNQVVSIASDPRLRGSGHGELLVCLDDLADSYLDLSNHWRSEETLKRVIAICDKPFGGKHRDLLSRYRSLACLYIDQGRYSEADPLVERALALVKREHKMNNGARIDLMNIASAYRSKGNSKKAVWLEQEAKRLAQNDKSRKYLPIPFDAQRAQVLIEEGKFKQAQPLIEKAIAEVKRREGENSISLLPLFDIQAEALSGQKHYDEADKILVRAINLQKRLRIDEWLMTERIQKRANNLRDMGRQKEANALEKEVKQMRFTYYFGSGK
ncbi:MAG TPA: tetratricopeptide repeat protein [Candidatus Obscuribacterales bacterium]